LQEPAQRKNEFKVDKNSNLGYYTLYVGAQLDTSKDIAASVLWKVQEDSSRSSIWIM
jgi:hypothetical protein